MPKQPQFTSVVLESQLVTSPFTLKSVSLRTIILLNSYYVPCTLLSVGLQHRTKGINKFSTQSRFQYHPSFDYIERQPPRPQSLSTWYHLVPSQCQALKYRGTRHVPPWKSVHWLFPEASRGGDLSKGFAVAQNLNFAHGLGPLLTPQGGGVQSAWPQPLCHDVSWPRARDLALTHLVISNSQKGRVRG